MSIMIAGRAVKKGDSLYHRGFEAWGYVSRFDPSGSAEYILKGPHGERKMLVLNGGIVNGRRQLFWHEPIQLDLPRQDVKSLQRVVDAVAAELSAIDLPKVNSEGHA